MTAMGGRIFIELKFTFDCVSSPGVFDIVSDTIRDIAIVNTG